MAILLLIVSFASFALSSSSTSSSYPVGDIRNCPTSQLTDDTKSLMRMDVLPGLGFDALRSLDTGQVYNYNYSTCQISADGLYMLPDNIRLIPILNSQVDFTADMYEHADDWSSETSHSLNVHAKASYCDINAKFSMDYQKTKTKMANEKSHATRAGLRYHLYSVEINPDSQLNPLFKSRILDIAANIQNKNTKIAHYLSEKLVRDYGTHVITGIDAGARLSQTTFFTANFEALTESDRLNISATASAKFFNAFSISTTYTFTHNTKQDSTTKSQTQSSYTTTHGGPMYLLGNDFTYADWEKEVPNHLVATDRRGEPIYSVLSPVTIPELPSVTLAEVSEYIHKAISRYYQVNTHTGCTDPTSGNFNFHANINDKSCEKPKTNFTFGGIYQTCENEDDSYDVCGSVNGSQTNPFTGGHSCPSGYQEVLLHSGTLKQGMNVRYPYCPKKKWYQRHHHCYTRTKVEVKSATYQAFWCSPMNSQGTDEGMYFGGFYTSTQANILTGTKSCPQFYFPLHFGENMEICAATDTQAQSDSLNFGGFYSCKVGNPMSLANTQQCPVHYHQLMVTIDEDCVINVCTDVQKALDYKPRPPILPPFQHNFHLYANDTNVLLLTDTSGVTWVKEANGEWSKYVNNDDTITTGFQLITTVTLSMMNISGSSTSMNESYNSIDEIMIMSNHPGGRMISMSDGELVGIIIGTMVGTASVIIFLWVVIGFGVKKYRGRKLNTAPHHNDAEALPLQMPDAGYGSRST